METLDNYEYEFSQEDVVIDPYSCDLNLVVDKECLLAYPLSSEGFCSMWAGCRSTYGVSSGRVAFEIHLSDYCESTDLAKDDLEPNLIRVGWSLNYSPLQLGESKFSFGYTSNGKKCTDKIFEDYGDTFEKGDSIAAYIDFESEKDMIIISYSKNGIDQGVAFRIKRYELSSFVSDIDGDSDTYAIFFPHVLTKNVVFEVNFGQRVSLIGDEPFAPIKNGFELIQKRPLDARHINPPRSTQKQDYEMILLIGLPGSGKSTWVQQLIEKNRKKNYFVIGLGSVLEKMKMLGIRKKANQAGELSQINSLDSPSPNLVKITSELLDKALKCMNTMMDVAANHSYRNMIIDQANVFRSTRRRKIKLFEGFKKKAVVILPSDEAYQQRIASFKSEDSMKENFYNLLNNMKNGFTLPNSEDYDSVEYIGLDETEGKKLVELYNSEGAADRLDHLLVRRAKKNEEIRKKSTLNPALFMRPTYRPQYSYGYGVPSSQYTRPRFGSQMMPPSAPMGVRARQFNPMFSNQYLRPGQVYPVDIGNPYAGQQLVYTATGAVYSPIIPPPPFASAMGSNDPSMVFGQWPHQQQPNQPQMMYGQYHPPTQYAPIYSTNQSQNQAAYQTQNSWDPVMSTNLSQSISESAYSTNLAYGSGLSSDNQSPSTPKNQNESN